MLMVKSVPPWREPPRRSPAAVAKNSAAKPVAQNSAAKPGGSKSRPATPEDSLEAYTKKEFVSQSGTDVVPMTKAGEQDRYSRWMDESHRRNTFPGNSYRRQEVQRLGLGASIPEVPRHQPTEPVSVAGKPFHGTVGQLMRDTARASHEEPLREMEHAGPEWLQRRMDVEQTQRETRACMQKWDKKELSEHHELAILSTNLGNWLRSGQTPASATRTNTLIPKFVLGDHSQISLVQESQSMLEGLGSCLYHLQDFQSLINDDHSKEAGLSIIVSLRQGGSRHRILESKSISPFGAKKTAVSYLIASIEMVSQETGRPIPFAGYSVWIVCNFHFDNNCATKPDVARRGCEMMIADCLHHKVNYMSGDGNQTVARGYLQEGLQSALDKHNAAQGLSDDAAVDAEVHKVGGDDCMVGIVFSWKDFKPKRVRMAKNLNLEKYELYLRPDDDDSHYPLKLFFGDGKRDRTELSQAFRDRSSRIRERERCHGQE